MKKIYFTVLILFIGVTNYAFIHHMVFEKHDIDYHIVKDKTEAHDHCTVCKVAEQSTTFLDSDFLPIENLDYQNFFVQTAFYAFKEQTNIFQRGPPKSI